MAWKFRAKYQSGERVSVTSYGRGCMIDALVVASGAPRGSDVTRHEEAGDSVYEVDGRTIFGGDALRLWRAL